MPRLPPVRGAAQHHHLGTGQTPDEKGLRDCNSPICTLSQNGYGANMWRSKRPTYIESCKHRQTKKGKNTCMIQEYLKILKLSSRPLF